MKVLRGFFFVLLFTIVPYLEGMSIDGYFTDLTNVLVQFNDLLGIVNEFDKIPQAKLDEIKKRFSESQPPYGLHLGSLDLSNLGLISLSGFEQFLNKLGIMVDFIGSIDLSGNNLSSAPVEIIKNLNNLQTITLGNSLAPNQLQFFLQEAKKIWPAAKVDTVTNTIVLGSRP